MSEDDIKKIAAELRKHIPINGTGRSASDDRMKLVAIGIMTASMLAFFQFVFLPQVNSIGADVNTLSAVVSNFHEATGRELSDHAARIKSVEDTVWHTRGNPAAPVRELRP